MRARLYSEGVLFAELDRAPIGDEIVLPLVPALSDVEPFRPGETFVVGGLKARRFEVREVIGDLMIAHEVPA